MILYNNRYRIESTRLKEWDYSANGYYSITICTDKRIYYFGDIKNGGMVLSAVGQMAYKYWHEIPYHFPFVMLDAFIIMPNHIHGIIIINKADYKYKECNFGKFSPQVKNMASIIRGYKIGVTKYAANNNLSFKWQPRYYDNIIRDRYHLNNVREYIKNNPKKWKIDKFNPSSSA